MSRIIDQSGVRRLVDGWIAQGKWAFGPVRIKPELVLYTRLPGSARLFLEGSPYPANSIKEFFFPRTEPLYTYRVVGNRIELEDCEPPAAEQLVIGARPCHAAALPILDPLFNWDYADEFYNRRRERTTVVALACNSHDEHCFCTSVGLHPGAERGADAMLYDLGDGEYEVRCFTSKGEALLAGATRESARAWTPPPGPPRLFDARRFDPQFDNPAWSRAALSCLGCGACAATCPTCHCFDIVDEGNAAGGVRVKNWDSCQHALFTLHASGHNPRPAQDQRQRQRLYHKFHMYPEKFGEILCTGCGNCGRNCPEGLGVLNVVMALETEHAQHLPA